MADTPTAGELALVIGRALPDVDADAIGRAAEAAHELVLERRRRAGAARMRAHRERRRSDAA